MIFLEDFCCSPRLSDGIVFEFFDMLLLLNNYVMMQAQKIINCLSQRYCNIFIIRFFVMEHDILVKQDFHWFKYTCQTFTGWYKSTCINFGLNPDTANCYISFVCVCDQNSFLPWDVFQDIWSMGSQETCSCSFFILGNCTCSLFRFSPFKS